MTKMKKRFLKRRGIEYGKRDVDDIIFYQLQYEYEEFNCHCYRSTG